MQRKRRSGASAGEIAEVPMPCGSPRVCGIWFTVAFRQTITIAAIGMPRRCVMPPLARWKEPVRPRRNSTRAPHPVRDAKTACRAMRRRWSDQQCGELGGAARHRRHEERGRRRTRQDQISRGGFKTAGEIADHEIRTERRKPVSSAGPVFERANSLERRSSRLT